MHNGGDGWAHITQVPAATGKRGGSATLHLSQGWGDEGENTGQAKGGGERYRPGEVVWGEGKVPLWGGSVGGSSQATAGEGASSLRQSRK